MASKNLALLIGNLGKDPEVRNVGDNTVAKFSVATTKSFKRGGEWEKKTAWHNIEVWGQAATYAGQYLKKGDLVCIEGEIDYQEWQGNDGQTKYMTVIKAYKVDGLERKGGGGQRSPQRNEGGHGGQRPPQRDDNKDDIPF